MEDFGYKKDEDENNFSTTAKKIFLVGATLFSIACFIYITISAYYFVYQDKESNIEVIRSPENPIKVLEDSPEKKESMQIDRSIYEDIFGNKSHLKKEISDVHLRQIVQPALPPKSLEIDRKLIKESDKKFLQESLREKTPKEENSKAKIQPEKIAEQKIIIFSDSQKKDSSSQDLLTKNSGNKTAEEPKPSEKTKKRTIRVQVAALNSKESAKDAWKNLNQANSDLFSQLKPFIQEIDLGKRGIFYRLQVGNFYNQIEAEEFCNRYVSQTQKSRADCIVVE